MYLLIFKGDRHLFSFYINSAKKKITVGGKDGDILFPSEMKGVELTMRKEFNFEKRDYSWTLYPVSGNFKLNKEKVVGGEIFEDDDVFSTGDYSFSFSPISNLSVFQKSDESTNFGNTVIMDEGSTEFHKVVFSFAGKDRVFNYREDREIKIGRKNADVNVGFNEVSVEHVLFKMRENGIYFWSKGKNGTWVNGVNVENGLLEEGKYHFLIAGKHEVTVKISREKSSESYYVGSLAPFFDKIEEWLNQPALFANHPIILLTGESGVGKEVFAEFIHKTSGRKGKFVTFNAASIPENLAESELFGTSKGGFTGAEERDGAFLTADGGTLFLDEIAEMPINLQSKLLRVIEDWKVKKVGQSGNGKKVDVNLVLATNRELEKAVEDQTFRKDLFYRLTTLHVNIPPLRERAEDIIPLSKHLYHGLSGRNLIIEDEAVEKMQALSWHGNVRELKSVITRFAYTGKDLLKASDL